MLRIPSNATTTRRGRVCSGASVADITGVTWYPCRSLISFTASVATANDRMLAAASALAAAFAYFSVRLAYQSWEFHDISTGNDATPLWIPQLAMAAGTVVLLVAFVDELALEWRGARERKMPEEALHHE